MRILLVMPDAHMHRIRLCGYVLSMREAPLTLTTLAALVPSDLNADVRIIDESVEAVPLEHPADVVGISVITGCARRAYALADHFRRRGSTVVLGGVHVTVLPDEARAHADAIVVGMAERSWPALLRDVEAGRLRSVYRDEIPADGWLRGVPPPRIDLQRRGRYAVPNTVQATRGCRRTCDFCTVPAVWPGYSRRPVADIVRDIRRFPGRTFVFNDVSLAEDREYARELFMAMVPLRKRWGGLVTLDVAKDAGMLDLMAESGCTYLLIGFESVRQEALRGIHKGFNKVSEYRRVVRMLRRRGIAVQACFVFGLDGDDATVFDETVGLVDDLGIDIPRYSLYTPYPGTELFTRLLREGRILSFNWDDYDTMHVVIRPARMTPEDLYAGFKRAYRETFRAGKILRRAARPNLTAVVNLVGNLTYRVFVHRLHADRRYAAPHSQGDADCSPDAAGTPRTEPAALVPAAGRAMPVSNRGRP